jgi:methylmalonyl-CoA mutase C-terminal domain/subunit
MTVHDESVPARPPKVLVTRIGLDAHDRGSRLVAGYLRDAGMEVLYTGPWQSIAAVVSMAIDEDVDLIGLSSLANDHLLVPKLMQAMRTAGLENVPVVIGGVIPEDDEAMLREAGVARVFRTGAKRDEIVQGLGTLIEQARATA